MLIMTSNIGSSQILDSFDDAEGSGDADGNMAGSGMALQYKEMQRLVGSQPLMFCSGGEDGSLTGGGGGQDDGGAETS